MICAYLFQSEIDHSPFLAAARVLKSRKQQKAVNENKANITLKKKQKHAHAESDRFLSEQQRIANVLCTHAILRTNSTSTTLESSERR